MSREEIEAEASKAAEQAFEVWKQATYHTNYEWHHAESGIARKAFKAGALHGAESRAKLEEIKEVLG